MISCSGLARGAARQKSQKIRIVAESKTTPGSGESQVLEPYRSGFSNRNRVGAKRTEKAAIGDRNQGGRKVE